MVKTVALLHLCTSLIYCKMTCTCMTKTAKTVSLAILSIILTCLILLVYVQQKLQKMCMAVPEYGVETPENQFLGPSNPDVLPAVCDKAGARICYNNNTLLFSTSTSKYDIHSINSVARMYIHQLGIGHKIIDSVNNVTTASSATPCIRGKVNNKAFADTQQQRICISLLLILAATSPIVCHRNNTCICMTQFLPLENGNKNIKAFAFIPQRQHNCIRLSHLLAALGPLKSHSNSICIRMDQQVLFDDGNVHNKAFAVFPQHQSNGISFSRSALALCQQKYHSNNTCSSMKKFVPIAALGPLKSHSNSICIRMDHQVPFDDKNVHI